MLLLAVWNVYVIKAYLKVVSIRKQTGVIWNLLVFGSHTWTDRRCCMFEVTSGGTVGAGAGWPCPPGCTGRPAPSNISLSPNALGSCPAFFAFISARATWARLGCSIFLPLMFNVFVITFDEQPVEAEYDPPNPRWLFPPWSWTSEPLEEDECALSMEVLFMLEYWVRLSSADSQRWRLAALSDLSRWGKKSRVKCRRTL